MIVRFEAFTAVTMMMMFFWVLAPCGLVGRCQRFGEMYYLIFRAEVTMLGNQRDYMGWKEGKSERIGQSGRSKVEIELGQWADSKQASEEWGRMEREGRYN
jgi:hypothetical protein